MSKFTDEEIRIAEEKLQALAGKHGIICCSNERERLASSFQQAQREVEFFNKVSRAANLLMAEIDELQKEVGIFGFVEKVIIEPRFSFSKICVVDILSLSAFLDSFPNERQVADAWREKFMAGRDPDDISPNEMREIERKTDEHTKKALQEFNEMEKLRGKRNIFVLLAPAERPFTFAETSRTLEKLGAKSFPLAFSSALLCNSFPFERRGAFLSWEGDEAWLCFKEDGEVRIYKTEMGFMGRYNFLALL